MGSTTVPVEISSTGSRDEVIIDEIEVEDLAVDSSCGVY
jgi:hypothetical protein